MDNRKVDEKQDEVDRMLNDPDSRMEPAKVWSLLAEISQSQTVPEAVSPA